MQENVLLDEQIRDWALLPIVIVTLLLQILKHYSFLLMKENKKVSAEHQRELQILQRSGYTRGNSGWVPQAAFDERKKKFTNSKDGYLHEKPDSQEGNPMASMADPSQMKGMMMQQLLGIGPHIGMMTWVSYFFSGFVIAKLPFPLTSRFRGMLQRGMEHPTLDVTYVTSVCGYFLVMMGIRGITTLMLGEASEFDDFEQMKNMSGGAMGGGGGGRGRQQVPMAQLFTAEVENWAEGLTVHNYHLNRMHL